MSGLFGFEKPNRVTEEGLPLSRVIMNLKPINRTLKIIKGDIGELPLATSWTQLCLTESETIHVSQADLRQPSTCSDCPSAGNHSSASTLNRMGVTWGWYQESRMFPAAPCYRWAGAPVWDSCRWRPGS